MDLIVEDKYVLIVLEAEVKIREERNRTTVKYSHLRPLKQELTSSVNSKSVHTPLHQSAQIRNTFGGDKQSDMAICMENRDAKGDSWEEFIEEATLLATTMQLTAYIIQNTHSHTTLDMFKELLEQCHHIILTIVTTQECYETRICEKLYAHLLPPVVRSHK
jgi:hypothetical protein